VAIETRDLPGARDIVRAVDDERAHIALDAERAVVDALGGGCQMPLGALAELVDADVMEVAATLVAPDGSRAIHARARGHRGDAAALGAKAAADLLAQGAREILGKLSTR
jgi:hydroxymethylbilane synthase